ncbi:ama1 protein, putative [Bodo saltans]|uniref:Ama1 protein, putative n=1 Tax=Bodo saltans TaxID=75058 RepID=A0A0S4ITT1_BODSA|nr:ama1 protein, putative [Bodo saltans]|eukprot:CUF90830.1 ama1 protein, putative [Bodo saltans]
MIVSKECVPKCNLPRSCFSCIKLSESKPNNIDQMQTFLPHAYNTRLFQCLVDNSSCLDGFFCPWCQTASQQNAFSPIPLPSRMKYHAATSLCIGELLCLGLPLRITNVFFRMKVKERFHLHEENESDVKSCCIGFWCVWCSVSQTYREMSIRHQWPGGVCVGDTPYAKPGVVAPQDEAFLAQQRMAQQLATLQSSQQQVLLQALRSGGGTAALMNDPYIQAQQLAAMAALQQQQQQHQQGQQHGMGNNSGALSLQIQQQQLLILQQQQQLLLLQQQQQYQTNSNPHNAQPPNNLYGDTWQSQHPNMVEGS